MKLAGKTDVGRVRQDNQDDYRAGEPVSYTHLDVYKRQVLIMDSDHVVLSALQPETVASRAAGQEGRASMEEETSHGE